MAETRKPYAVLTATGEIEYLGMHTGEDDCWRIYLGWPTVGEVKDAKARGLNCRPVVVTFDE
jgi:hypothetical protein